MSRLFQKRFYLLLIAVVINTVVSISVLAQPTAQDGAVPYAVIAEQETGTAGTTPDIVPFDANVEEEIGTANTLPDVVPTKTIVEKKTKTADTAPYVVSAGTIDAIKATVADVEIQHVKKTSVNTLVAVLFFSIFAIVVSVTIALAINRRTRLLRSALAGNSQTRQVTLAKLCRSKKDRKKTTEMILALCGNGKDEVIRATAIDALYLLADMEGSSTRKAEYLEIGLRDESSVVRSMACKGALKTPDAVIIARLMNQISLECDLQLQAEIVRSITQWKEREIRDAITQENFDSAETLVRELLTLNYEPTKAGDVLKRISALRQCKVNRQIAVALQCRQLRAAELVSQAAQKITENDCDAAESLIKQALAEDPLNQSAQNLLNDLPSLIHRVSLAAQARKHAELAHRIEKNKMEAIKALEGGSLDEATSYLIALTAMAPDDPWPEQAVASMPHLQSENRRAAMEREANARVAAITKLRDQLAIHWKQRELTQAMETAAELIALTPNDEGILAFRNRIVEAIRQETADTLYNEILENLSAGELDTAERQLRSFLAQDIDQSRFDAVIQRLHLLRKNIEDSVLRYETNRIATKVKKLQESAEDFLKKGKLENAMEMIEEALHQSPGHCTLINQRQHIQDVRRSRQAEFLLTKGMKLLEDGDFDQAESTLRSLVPIMDDSSRLLHTLGQMADIRQKHQSSVEADELNKMKAASQKAFREAQKLFEDGELSECARKLRRAIATNPGNDLASQLLHRVVQLDGLVASGRSVQKTKFDRYGQIVEEE